MQDLTFNIEEVEIVKLLTQFDSIEVVWDMNAFYFSSDQSTFKLECMVDKPVGSKYKYDEIFYCRLFDLKEKIEFKENDSNFWYKIISPNCKILRIQYLNVIELFPDNKIIPINAADKDKKGQNKLTLGLVIETDKGFLPAFLLPSNYGFQWQPKYGLYSKSEVEKLIEEKIPDYEIINSA